MTADSNSHIAWQRVQLKKHRAALKALDVAQFNGSGSNRQVRRTIAELQRKIAEAVRCIADYERRTRRPLGTDLGSLSSVSWSHWNANAVSAPSPRRRA